MKKIAINGFGRIGRCAFKIALERADSEIVAINDLTDAKTLAHLLRYDTAYGTYRREVSAENGAIVVDGKRYPVYAEPDPKKLPWKELGVDVVLECTGRFVDGDSAGQHLAAGAKKVVLSAPPKGENEIPTFLIGVNDREYAGQPIVSNASCTTNCIAPVAKIIAGKFGIEKAMMTTIHSYTADQNLEDGPHKDLRRARAAAQNIVPTTTGAAISVTHIMPEIAGKFDGLAVRVPTIVGSLTDFTFLVSKKTTAEEVNAALEAAAGDPEYSRALSVTREPLVSSDFVGNPYSSIVDLSLTKVVDGDLVKVMAWYDNEWGYSNRLVELAEEV
ncbi:MAG: type I glyceraldehyde-3-phosphate dehydrogenase [Candidatus Moranbacteria bacterium]|nr:type I glyceraldehyde-3-phosphate dehydrogenase [Candidatus Moranbacteria bacterium]NTW46385.1 type I glyceraldehyde-3-phosphate dehydrogenase [Candidatus Moranbacteria bacterium]